MPVIVLKIATGVEVLMKWLMVFAALLIASIFAGLGFAELLGYGRRK